MNKKKTHVEKFRANHHAALESMATNGEDGLSLWRKLRRIERIASNAAAAQCNGENYRGEPYRDEGRWDDFCKAIEYRMGHIFGKIPDGFFFNKDPRGYALKIAPEVAKTMGGLHKDWGGNGILAAEIN
jgi:hypothetical protein